MEYSQRHEKMAGGTAQNTVPPMESGYIAPSGKSGEPDQDIPHSCP